MAGRGRLPSGHLVFGDKNKMWVDVTVPVHSRIIGTVIYCPCFNRIKSWMLFQGLRKCAPCANQTSHSIEFK
jgi:hypothetical protein